VIIKGIFEKYSAFASSVQCTTGVLSGAISKSKWCSASVKVFKNPEKFDLRGWDFHPGYSLVPKLRLGNVSTEAPASRATSAADVNPNVPRSWSFEIVGSQARAWEPALSWSSK
jgi:hypothetical protein